MTAESSFLQLAIPKFDAHYDHLSMLMENFLSSKEFWTIVKDGIPKHGEGVTLTDAQTKSIEDLKLKNLKAKNYLFQAINRSILVAILQKDMTKEIWDSMKKKYHGTTRVKLAQLQALRKEFEVSNMKAGESVNDYFAQTLIVANKMGILVRKWRM